jgi:hypothetical protein
VAGSCEYGNENLGSVKAGNFLNGWVTLSFTKELRFMELE